jgi:hypothetical protein
MLPKKTKVSLKNNNISRKKIINFAGNKISPLINQYGIIRKVYFVFKDKFTAENSS